MIHVLYSLVIAALLPWAAVAEDQKPEPSPVNNSPYYESVLKTCDRRAGEACCRASVIAMYKETASPISLKDGCPQGFTPTSLPCPASLNWCRVNGYKPPK